MTLQRCVPQPRAQPLCVQKQPTRFFLSPPASPAASARAGFHPEPREAPTGRTWWRMMRLAPLQSTTMGLQIPEPARIGPQTGHALSLRIAYRCSLARPVPMTRQARARDVTKDCTPGPAQRALERRCLACRHVRHPGLLSPRP